MNDRSSAKPTRGRPRSEQSREAVLGAVQQLLRAGGYGNLTMEGIAKAAGVGKPTLYRWWPGVPAIVLEALRQQADTGIAIPDTGSLRDDLLQFMERTCHMVSGYSGDVLRCLMADAQLHPDFAPVFREELILPRRKNFMAVIKRHMAEDEPESADKLEFLADLFYGPMWYRLLCGHAALDDKFVHAVADQIMSNIDGAML